MRKLDAWLERIKDVERQYLAAQVAATYFLEQVQRDPTILPDHLRLRAVTRMKNELEATYFIRLFAEFESGLRTYWRIKRRKQELQANPKLLSDRS